ncbi:MAG: hypothetical protein ABL982_06325 [Vicinamibacterales bacterium]
MANLRDPYALALLGSVVVTGAAFMPWFHVGAVGLPGVPDPAGSFVAAMGLTGVGLSAVGLRTKRDTRQGLVLAGLATITTLVVAWQVGPATIASRAQARAEAVALVDNVNVEPVPPVGVSAGLFGGMAGAAVVAAAGVTGLRRRTGR